MAAREQETEEVVMESTAQYWKPVWEALERYWKPICEKREGARRRSGTLHLAQALSNRGRRGRKRDFPDAERLVKRLVARELTLSFVPDAEQRLWRTVTAEPHLWVRSYPSKYSTRHRSSLTEFLVRATTPKGGPCLTRTYHGGRQLFPNRVMSELPVIRPKPAVSARIGYYIVRTARNRVVPSTTR